MNTVEVLKEMRELLSKPGAWTQGTYARDARGDFSVTYDRKAVSYCLLGSMYCIRHGHENVDTTHIRQYLREYTGEDIASWNDKFGRTQDEVLALLDRAIKAESPKVES